MCKQDKSRINNLITAIYQLPQPLTNKAQVSRMYAINSIRLKQGKYNRCTQNQATFGLKHNIISFPNSVMVQKTYVQDFLTHTHTYAPRHACTQIYTHTHTHTHTHLVHEKKRHENIHKPDFILYCIITGGTR
jgi:hypothetical protein